MKIKPGFILRQLAGENVVVPVGAAGESFNGMIRLNETGVLLWRELSQGAEKEALAEKLLETYGGVTREQALADVGEFLDSIRVALDG